MEQTSLYLLRFSVYIIAFQWGSGTTCTLNETCNGSKIVTSLCIQALNSSYLPNCCNQYPAESIFLLIMLFFCQSVDFYLTSKTFPWSYKVHKHGNESRNSNFHADSAFVQLPLHHASFIFLPSIVATLFKKLLYCCFCGECKNHFLNFWRFLNGWGRLFWTFKFTRSVQKKEE